MRGLVLVCELVVRCMDEIRSQIIELDLDNEYNHRRDVKKILEEYVKSAHCEVVKIISVNVEKKCIGCRTNAPGQRAHMDEGGCLYEGSEEF